MVIKDGSKMSKSKGNVVSPEEIIKKWCRYTRLFIYLLLTRQLTLNGVTGVKEGAWRFIQRVWRIILSYADEVKENPTFDVKHSLKKKRYSVF